MNKFLLSFSVLLFVHLTSLAQRAVPALWGHRVHDEAHILSQGVIDSLELKLKQHEDSTSNQIAILIIPSLDGEVLEEYALHVAHDVWKLGTKDKDNGVLLLIAVDDRKMRIEVGYGLEGALTDAVSRRILRNEIAPNFRAQRYDEGVTAAIDAIIAAIHGEYTASDEPDLSSDADMTLTERLLIGAFIFGILGIFTVLGICIRDKAGWFIYAFLVIFYAVFPWIVLGFAGGMIALGIYLVGFPIARMLLQRSAWYKKKLSKLNRGGASARRKSSASAWFDTGSSSWSSGSSSSDWSSGSSSSDFSGGGGSFGGGGSSDSW
ncbi:MAG TPA: TPM domain-containing protein [Ohtaekwangia sp.]|uniref:TPM domain-containing protein n=1 Tax=Ohtaekwangia sp. TaxID=2066019 RepID=UPI002F92626F